jgi:hypothetical protein
MGESAKTSGVHKREDEVSFKDIILQLRTWWKYLLSKWLIIGLVVIIGAGLGLTYAFKKKVKYVALLTFVLEDSKSSPLGAYAGLASQFGFDLGGGASSGVFAGDNIMEFLKSRLMLEKALLSQLTTSDSNQTSLADWYIEFNGMRKGWQEDPVLKDIHFPANLDRANFTLQQDSILNIIQGEVLKKCLTIEKIDKKLSFVSVTCSSIDEIFSKKFTERLVRVATDFYIATKTMRNKVNVDRLQLQADSLEVQLNRKTYSAARTQDLNSNPARQVANVNSELALRDKMVLQTMYGEVVKNLELSKISMSQETPVIQIIDSPILPLNKNRLGKLKGIIIGGFLGGFLIVGILLARFLFKNVMEES